MSESSPTIPRWFLALASVALVCVSAWAIRETMRPKESWIVLNQIGMDADTGIPGAWVLLDQHSGTWCLVSFRGTSSAKIDPKGPVLSPEEFEKTQNQPGPTRCYPIR